MAEEKRRQARISRTVQERPATEAILDHWREREPNDRLAHLVKDAMRALARALQTRLSKYKVSYGHWTFLRLLWEEEGLTQRALSERAGVQEPTTFAALKAMEKLGYVTRRQLPSSRKNVYVFLTPKGRALKRKLTPLAIAVNEVAVEGLKDEAMMATRRTLLAIIENLARDEAAHAGKRRILSTRELGRALVDAEAVLEAGRRDRAYPEAR
jgi:MarR family transcriptional regulator, organic hydroperoxide resistance regulator